MQKFHCHQSQNAPPRAAKSSCPFKHAPPRPSDYFDNHAIKHILTHRRKNYVFESRFTRHHSRPVSANSHQILDWNPPIYDPISNTRQKPVIRAVTSSAHEIHVPYCVPMLVRVALELLPTLALAPHRTGSLPALHLHYAALDYCPRVCLYHASLDHYPQVYHSICARATLDRSLRLYLQLRCTRLLPIDHILFFGRKEKRKRGSSGPHHARHAPIGIRCADPITDLVGSFFFVFWPIVGLFVVLAQVGLASWPMPIHLCRWPSASLLSSPAMFALRFHYRPTMVHLCRHHLPPSLATRKLLVFSSSVRTQYSPLAHAGPSSSPPHAAVAGHLPASCLLRQCSLSVFTTGPCRSIFVAATCCRCWPPTSLLSLLTVFALSLHHGPPFISHCLCLVPDFRCRRHQEKKKKRSLIIR